MKNKNSRPRPVSRAGSEYKNVPTLLSYLANGPQAAFAAGSEYKNVPITHISTQPYIPHWPKIWTVGLSHSMNVISVSCLISCLQHSLCRSWELKGFESTQALGIVSSSLQHSYLALVHHTYS